MAQPFEGSEKRLELVFGPAGSGSGSLRALRREQIDELLALSGCSVVACRAHPAMDSYVLSESSLFVEDARWVVKTCGTTRALAHLARLLELASSELGLGLQACTYTRASFLFPAAQPAPHRSFEEETAELDGLLGPAPCLDRDVFVLRASEDPRDLVWHVYSWASGRAVGEAAPPPRRRVEVCMTGLCEDAARAFHAPASPSAAATGLPGGALGRAGMSVWPAALEEHAFEPCGYSLNAVLSDGAGYATVHVTPEPAFSYASVEVDGAAAAAAADMEALLADVLDAFRPARACVVLTAQSSTLSSIGAYDLAGACEAGSVQHLSLVRRPGVS